MFILMLCLIYRYLFGINTEKKLTGRKGKDNVNSNVMRLVEEVNQFNAILKDNSK